MAENPEVFSKTWVKDALGGYPGAKKGVLPDPLSDQEVRDVRKEHFRIQAQQQQQQQQQAPPPPQPAPSSATPQMPLPAFNFNAMFLPLMAALALSQNTGMAPVAPSPLFNQQAMNMAGPAAAAAVPAPPAASQQYQGTGFRGGRGGQGRGRGGGRGGRGRGGGRGGAAQGQVDPLVAAARAVAPAAETEDVEMEEDDEAPVANNNNRRENGGGDDGSVAHWRLTLVQNAPVDLREDQGVPAPRNHHSTMPVPLVVPADDGHESDSPPPSSPSKQWLWHY